MLTSREGSDGKGGRGGIFVKRSVKITAHFAQAQYSAHTPFPLEVPLRRNVWALAISLWGRLLQNGLRWLKSSSQQIVVCVLAAASPQPGLPQSGGLVLFTYWMTFNLR